MRLAFLGLGNMGLPMARNLARAGHALACYDPAGVDAEAFGARSASTAAAAAEGAEVVLAMLPDGAVLRAVAGEVIPAMAGGAILLDCSTVDVDAARAVAAHAGAAGLGFLDAPVSGGIGGAEGGTLTFMVGGSADALERVRPLLDVMGGRVVHCGAAGNGQAAKVCNNMILGATMAATCESFALARRLGLDAGALYDVVSTSSGQSWSTTTYCPVPGVGPESPADRGYRPGFAAELMLKDLRLALDAARSAGATVPMGRAAEAEYAAWVEAGDGRGRDFSALYPRYAED